VVEPSGAPLDVPEEEPPLDVPEELPLDVPDELPLEVPDEVPELLVAVPSAVEPSGPLLLSPPLLPLPPQPATQSRPAEHAIKQPTATKCLIDFPRDTTLWGFAR
jgi:hypothetical protein